MRGPRHTTLAKILGVRTDEVLGERLPRSRKNGPVGRTRRVFETVSALPRHQQQKIIDVVEALIAQTTMRKAG